MKRCYKCKQEKPETEFGRNKSKLDGLDDECRSCKNEYKRRWSAGHKAQRKATKDKWRNTPAGRACDDNWSRMKREARAKVRAEKDAKGRVAGQNGQGLEDREDAHPIHP